jgi:hypothetical protein
MIDRLLLLHLRLDGLTCVIRTRSGWPRNAARAARKVVLPALLWPKYHQQSAGKYGFSGKLLQECCGRPRSARSPPLDGVGEVKAVAIALVDGKHGATVAKRRRSTRFCAGGKV